MLLVREFFKVGFRLGVESNSGGWVWGLGLAFCSAVEMAGNGICVE